MTKSYKSDLSEADARDFIGVLEFFARDALAAKALTLENSKELERAVERLKWSFDQLVEWYIEPVRETAPDVADFGYNKLWDLMGAAFVIGQHVGFIDKRAQKILRDAQAGFMRSEKAKSSDVAARHKVLDAAIVKCAAALKRKLAISEKFADQIRWGLAAELGYEPTTSAIKDGVRRIRGRKKVSS